MSISKVIYKALGLSVLSFLIAGPVSAATVHIRWEQQFGLTGQLQQVLKHLTQTPGVPALTVNDFLEVENRVLANYRFATYLQLSQGVPIKGAMIRTWEAVGDGHLVLMDAHVDDGAVQPLRLRALRDRGLVSTSLPQRLNALDTRALMTANIRSQRTDRKIVSMKSTDQWNGTDLERVTRVSGRRGVHTIVYSHLTGQVKSRTYREYPQADIPALVYPIYEESEAKHLPQQRIPVLLRNLNQFRREAQGDAYASIKRRRYFDSLHDEVKSSTPAGQAQGYWSMPALRSLIDAIINNMPVVPNDIANGGIELEGKYAIVNIHPDAAKFSGVTVPLRPSEQAMFNWTATTFNGHPDYEMTLSSPLKSQPLLDTQSALNRVARRSPDHDPATYINDGFDEIQVYYAIDTLMESLQSMGMTDPELSTRPFRAYLFNPDVEMRDNAFYTEDTINFTTYSPDALNYARDNSTIWHELGHGVMDRLMGSRIRLADSGGLSEGMADFIAQLVVQDKTNGVPFDGSEDFRIINTIGFNLTNESHDDGEAYGGAMRDFLMAAIARDGRAGLVKSADITMDAMRLARNHPALTANDWFDAVLFADRLGRTGVRTPGEYASLISQALSRRNFRFDRGTPADFIVKSDGSVLTDETLGSRYNPVIHRHKVGESTSHQLEVSLASSSVYQFKYPVTIEAQFNGGPLQGAVKWANEASGTQKFVLNSEADKAQISVTALAGCDSVNREDGSCQDFVYLRVINSGETSAVAKKRFYVRVYDGSQP